MKKHFAILAIVFLLFIPTSGLFAAAQEEMAGGEDDVHVARRRLEHRDRGR